MGRAFSDREILIFLLFLVCFSYFYVPGGWNENSRFDLIYSMAHNGTLWIDSYHENTQDKSYFEEHYYSDKAPGSSFLGLIPYMIFYPLLPNPDASEYLIRFLVVSLPSAFMCLLIYRISGEFTKKEKHRLLVTIAYGLGTLVFPYSVMFYGHQIAGVLVLSSFYLIFRNQRRLTHEHLFSVGLMMGIAAITEFPVAIISVLMFFYALKVLENRENISFFIAGIIPPLILLFSYNFLCFGSPLSLGYSHLVFQDSIGYQSQGFLGVSLPDPYALYGILLSPYRGLFFFSPFLLLCIPGFYHFYRNHRLRKEFWLFFLSVLAFILWNSAYSVWWGGWATGPRHLIPVIPFMIIPVMMYTREFDEWRERAAIALAAISVFLVSLVTITDPNLPEKTYHPLFQHTLPMLARGEIGMNFGSILGLHGWFSLVPLAAALAIISWLLVRENRRKNED
ncbi:MAG: hypothetical protein JW754_01690 [Candidatus Aenigmarchaeota archaeon]|nr:hypothetical protein [Candidatus Aenigmarchaeota archaeon]